jgi:hypothetical protein
MPTLGPLLIAMFAGLLVLVFHRDPRTLRNGHTLLGTYAGLAGAALSLAYAYQVSFVILAAGSTDNCAAAFGLKGDRSSLRSLVSVTRQDFPPKVTCTYEGRNVTLTDPSTTHTWVHVWWISVGLLTVSVALATWGLIATRGWRKRVIPKG